MMMHLQTLMQLKNLTENHIPALCLKELAEGKKGILLGENLFDEELSLIKKHREQLFLVAVSEASPWLFHMEIIPDVMVCMEPTEKMFVLSEKALFFDPFPILVQGAATHHLLTSAWPPSQQVYLGQRVPWESPLNAENIPVVGPTAIHSALTLMVEMGFQKIYLTGVNFNPRSDEMSQLLQQIKDAKKRGCMIYNTSKESTLAKHVEGEPLSKKAFESEALSLFQAMKKVLKKEEYSDKKIYYRYLLEHLYPVKKQIYEFNYLVKKTLLLMRQKTPCNQEQKLSHLIKAIEEDTSQVLTLIKIPDAQEEGGLCSEEKIKIDLTEYGKSATELIDLLQETILRIKARQQELHDKPNYSLILSQWQKDNHYYRGIYFLKKQRKNLCKETVKKFEDFFIKTKPFLPKD